MPVTSSIAAKRCSAGFSLIDTLAAFVVLAVGLLGLSRFHYGALGVSADAKTRTEALNLAQGKLEGFRDFAGLMDYYQTIVASDVDADGDSDAIGVAEDGHGGTLFSEVFRRSWEVEQTGAGLSSYKKIRVTTQWTDSRNKAQRVLLSSIIAAERPIATGKALQALGEKIVSCACQNTGPSAVLHGGNPAPCSDACCQAGDPGGSAPYEFGAYCHAGQP